MKEEDLKSQSMQDTRTKQVYPENIGKHIVTELKLR